MTEKDKRLLEEEMKRFSDSNYNKGIIKSPDLKLIHPILFILGSVSQKIALKMLINNEYGVLGTLLYKQIKYPEADLSELIERFDEKVIKDGYEKYGVKIINSCDFLSDDFSMKVLIGLDEKAIDKIPDFRRRDKVFLVEAAKINPKVMKIAAYKLTKDREFNLKMCKANSECLQYMSYQMRQDREIVYEAVRKDGNTIRWADYKWRCDREIVEIAVNQNWRALSYVSLELANDLDVVKIALQKSPLAIQYASESIRANTDVMKFIEKGTEKWQQ